MVKVREGTLSLKQAWFTSTCNEDSYNVCSIGVRRIGLNCRGKGIVGKGEYHCICLYLSPNMPILTAIRKHVISMLTDGLSASLFYHDVNHTLDVTKQCLVIAKAQNIIDEQSLLELE